MHIRNVIKFYAWVILAYSIWFLSILLTGISCFSRENNDMKQTHEIVLFSLSTRGLNLVIGIEILTIDHF